MIADLRNAFNANFPQNGYQKLLGELDLRCKTKVEFRVAETPVFLPNELLTQMADIGLAMTHKLVGWPEYLKGAQASIPEGYQIAGESPRPNFMTADFALISDSATDLESGNWSNLTPRLVEIQAFPSVFAYQSVLSRTYADVFHLPETLGVYLGGLTEESFWAMLKKTIVGKHSPENVVLTEVDPLHQKTLPDFILTRERLGVGVVDIATIVPVGNKLHYRSEAGQLVPIHRIYNRAIADEMIARKIQLQFDLTGDWDVEWAGHPNWYFLISKYSVPWLSKLRGGDAPLGEYVPPAVFLDDFLGGAGFEELIAAGVELPQGDGVDLIYENLLLKPLFSFAGKGIQFAPSRAELLAIPEQERKNFLLQQKMSFVPTIRTPHGLTQAEIRILYLWPDGGELTPAISLVRLGRGKMMGVDHNRNQEWVGGSAAFWR